MMFIYENISMKTNANIIKKRIEAKKAANKRVTTSMSVKESTLIAFKKLVDAQNLSASEVIETMMEEYVASASK